MFLLNWLGNSAALKPESTKWFPPAPAKLPRWRNNPSSVMHGGGALTGVVRFFEWGDMGGWWKNGAGGWRAGVGVGPAPSGIPAPWIPRRRPIVFWQIVSEGLFDDVGISCGSCWVRLGELYWNQWNVQY